MDAVARLKARDAAVKVTSICGRFRIIAAVTTNLVNEALKRNPLELMENAKEHRDGLTEMFATTATWTNMMAVTLRQEERFTVKLNTPIGVPVVESLALGECRGYFQQSPGAEDAQFTTVASRILYGKSESVLSATSLVPENLREWHNFTPHAHNFMYRSEGTPTACLMLAMPGALATGDTCWSGGVMVQALAAEDEHNELIVNLQSSFDRAWSFPPSTADQPENVLLHHLNAREKEGLLLMDLLTAASGCTKSLPEVARKARLNEGDMNPILAAVGDLPAIELDPATVERTALDFMCRCSKAAFVDNLAAAGKDKLVKLRMENPAMPMKCSYCRKVYTMEPADWERVEAVFKPIA